MRALLRRLAHAAGWRLERLHKHRLFQRARRHRAALRNTVFVGITGSTGKTTAKDMIATILGRALGPGSQGKGSDNYAEDIAQLVLSTRRSDPFCVCEVGIHTPIDFQLALLRPSIGVVTNVGTDHLSLFRTQEAIALEKRKLVRALPADGIAVLNTDDPRVAGMAEGFAGRVVTYGLSGSAMVRGEGVRAGWPERLSFTATVGDDSALVQTQFCGEHWSGTVLAALAAGVGLGVPLAAAAKAIASVQPFEGRMQPVTVDGITFICDDWKAPFPTIKTTIDFMRGARAKRKVMVFGNISDLPGDSSKRYARIAESALEACDAVVFVGPNATAALRARRQRGAKLMVFGTVRDAHRFLSGYLQADDLVLLKGSYRADHLHRLVLARSMEIVCWKQACGRNYICTSCPLVRVPAYDESDSATLAASTSYAMSFDEAGHARELVVVGLGNPDPGYRDTPHNAGREAVSRLAQRLGLSWPSAEDDVSVIATTIDGVPVMLVQIALAMNSSGGALHRLTQRLRIDLERCIVVHDDLSLDVGATRTRLRGSDGGHRGVRSIIESYQNDRFPRVKIGVGAPAPGTSVTDHVLSPFRPEQGAVITRAYDDAIERVLALVRESGPRADVGQSAA